MHVKHTNEAIKVTAGWVRVAGEEGWRPVGREGRAAASRGLGAADRRCDN